MILILYQLMCAYMAALMIRGLFAEGKKGEKTMIAFMLVPFLLRLLLIK